MCDAKEVKCGDPKLIVTLGSLPVDVEELLLSSAGIDALAQAVPGVMGSPGAAGEEGVGLELGLEPGDVRGGGSDGRGGGSCGGSGDGCGGVGGGRRAGAEVPRGGRGGRGERGEDEEDEQRGGGEQQQQRRHGEKPQPRRGGARRQRHRRRKRGLGVVRKIGISRLEVRCYC